MQVIRQDFFSFQQLGRKVCDSWAAPAKTNAQGYRHANYALPDTRVFVSHLSQIFLPNRWNQKILPDCPVCFGELGERPRDANPSC